MKSFIVLALFVAAALAAPAGPDATAETVYQESDNIGLGEYSNRYKTSNGIEAEEQGRLENPGTKEEGISVRGQFSYLGPDGVIYSVAYTADQFGFQPQGAHLPAVA